MAVLIQNCSSNWFSLWQQSVQLGLFDHDFEVLRVFFLVKGGLVDIVALQEMFFVVSNSILRTQIKVFAPPMER